MNANAPQPTPADMRRQGRYIRAALMILPLGTILLGMGSFGIWAWQKQQAARRNYEFASAMRREVTPEAVRRNVEILSDALARPEQRRLPAVASFLESTMGPENMGYEVRREPLKVGELEVANIDAELTGRKRPREVILILIPYGDRGRIEAESHALAALMAAAHAVTGGNRAQTLRFAGLPWQSRDSAGRSALEIFAERGRERGERLMQLRVLGGPSEAALREIREAFRTEPQGTAVTPVPATATVDETVALAASLQALIMSQPVD